MTDINDEAEQHRILASGVKHSFVEGNKNFKRKVIRMLEEKLNHFENVPNQHIRDKIGTINEILTDIHNLKV